mgnify:CR=1 FL=1
MPLNVRVRGIYSTALSKIFKDSGFRITDPSYIQMERLNLDGINEEPDIRIYDRRDFQGVIADGDGGSLRTLQELVHSSLEDAVFQLFPYSIRGIYRGIILEEREDSVLVDLGTALGRLRKTGLKNEDLKRKSVTVQVLDSAYHMHSPYLTTMLRVPGKYAVLVKYGGIKVSRKIRDPEERKRLFELGKEVARKEWGLIWRTRAEGKTSEELESEVEHLLMEAERILEDGDAPEILKEGFNRVSIEFPYISKKRLDELRSEVTPTIRNHHYYKACGGYISAAVDMAENLLKRGERREYVDDAFRKVVSGMFPSTGSRIQIEHVKFDGRRFNLGSAEVEFADEDYTLLRLRRIIRGRGLYDGLETVREPGDYSVTETGFGSWILKSSYFSKDGVFKGAYINLNTPVEVYPHSIRYIDLEVDVCLEPDGEVKVVDEELLERAFEEHLITKVLMEKTRKNLELTLDQLKNALKENPPQKALLHVPIITSHKN